MNHYSTVHTVVNSPVNVYPVDGSNVIFNNETFVIKYFLNVLVLNDYTIITMIYAKTGFSTLM